MSGMVSNAEPWVTTVGAAVTRLNEATVRLGDGTSIAVERLAQVAVHDGIGALRTEIVRALAKLDEGTYGRCDRCGGPIPEGRLEARPWATHCVPCPSDGPG